MKAGRTLTQIKIYRINQLDYVAAKSFDEAIQFFCNLMDMPIDEIDEVVELDDEVMNRLRHYAEEPEWDEMNEEYELGHSVTFKEALQNKIDNGDEFPLHFATVDW